MLVDADASGLEYRVAAELSGDKLMIQELADGLDIHGMNATNFFGDFSFRQDAKIFTFRLLYGGTSYAFFMDKKMPNFTQKRWDKIVQEFYEKYATLKKWQDENFKLVCKQGWLQVFTGRMYHFKPVKQNDGSWQYERPSVCNYPVQGTSTGDIIPLVMCQIYNKLQQLELYDVKIINQVHDSIVFDCPKKDIDQLAEICYHYFRNIPQAVKQYWNYNWITPMDGEVKVGYDWSDMTKIKA